MGDKRQWAKSTNGPDWTDICTLMRAIGALHSGVVSVQCSPDGIGSDTGLVLRAVIRLDVLPGSSLPKKVDVQEVWPNRESATVEGAVFRLLYTLDFEISKVYKNEALWK